MLFLLLYITEDRGSTAEVHVSIGLLGYGAVGKAFAEKTLELEGHPNFRIHAILVRDNTADKKFGDVEITDDAEWFLPSWGHNIIVDAASYSEDVKYLVIQSLLDGKDLITCNKEMVAKHWEELLEAAAKGGGKIYFDAIPSSTEPTEFSDVSLTSDNFHLYADKDLYSFRGGDAEVTAEFLYKVVTSILEERSKRHDEWEKTQREL